MSFVRRERLTPAQLREAGHARIPPDLAVEVVSAHDLFTEVQVKAGEYLAAGVPLVWLVDPKAEQVLVYRGDGSAARLTAADMLSGGDVLPGFECRLAELFALD